MPTSSPENTKSTDEHPGPSMSPEERQGPQKTRYGRIIVPKGSLPGEDIVPKNRKKKGKKEEPERPKRKYTKRQTKEESVEEKKQESIEEKEVKMEVEEEDEESQEPELEPNEYLVNPVPLLKSGQPSGLPVPLPFEKPDYIKNTMCQYCEKEVANYHMEEHLMENHPHHAKFECFSCRVRSFFSYWDLKSHYRECSNNIIGCPINNDSIIHPKAVIEKPYFIRLYQPVECPFCKIYLDTFFDLEVHLNVHGLASMDSKFGCDGCKFTFTSIESLKEHLHDSYNKRSTRCFNKGRVLNRREIEKLKERYLDEDRKDCMRKYNDLSYVISAPKILEASEEATCAFCSKDTRAYALLKTDLSNLEIYGLKCNPDIQQAILEKLHNDRHESKPSDRVPLCRAHFLWRNSRTMEEEAALNQSKVALQEEMRQIVIQRKEQEEKAPANADGIAVLRDTVRIGGPFTNNHSYFGNKEQAVKVEEEDDSYEILDREGKNGRRYDDEDEEEGYEIVDISDDEGTAAGNSKGPILSINMNQEELEEKAIAGLHTAYECPVCSQSYPSLNDLHDHQSAHTYSRLVYICADCPNKQFDTPEKIERHFDEKKKKSAVAAFYSFKVIVQAEVHTHPKETLKQ